MLSISDIKTDIKTVDQFMFYCREDDADFEPVLVYECTEEEFMKNRTNLGKIFSVEPTAFKMRLQLKITFGDSGDSIILEKQGNIDLSKLAQYKSIFGYDQFYLKVK